MSEFLENCDEMIIKWKHHSAELPKNEGWGDDIKFLFRLARVFMRRRKYFQK